MIKKLGWIRIACVCILILGLLGCAGNCSGKETPIETVPGSAAPENNGIGTDTITEDSVVPSGANGETNAQPTIPANTDPSDPGTATVTEAPAADETEAPADVTPDPLEIDPDDLPTPTSGTGNNTATPKPTATPEPGETSGDSESPSPTESGPIELPELP